MGESERAKYEICDMKQLSSGLQEKNNFNCIIVSNLHPSAFCVLELFCDVTENK